MIASGIVLTGGSSKMPGVIELAEDVFKMPVRLGVPKMVRGLVDVIHNPIYSTGVGLLLYGKQQQSERNLDTRMTEGLPGMWGKVKRWIQGNF